MEDKKIPEKVVLGILIVCFVLSFAYNGLYVPFKNTLKNQADEIQSLKDQQGQTITQNDAQLKALQQKANEAENAATQAENVAKSSGSNTTSLVNEWSSHIVHVICTNDGQNFSLGSGTLTNMNLDANSGNGAYSGPVIITNAHVVLYDRSNQYLYNSCGFKVLGDPTVYILDPQTFHYSSTQDVEWIPVESALYPNASFSSIQNVKICSGTASIGDSIVVLGYPENGGTNGNITATEGIVSSYDGLFYVTSAKIDHGNSGGVAILAKDDCYLGIPTWAESGGFESLGRILDHAQIIL